MPDIQRQVITPEVLSLDFLINLLRVDGPLGLNLDPALFTRDVVDGKIRPVQLTAAQIKTLYESNLDTNALTNALLTKLNGLGAPETTDTKTGDYTLVADDFVGNKTILMNVASPNTITMPSGIISTNPVNLVQTGAGTTAIVQGAGATLRGADGALIFRVRYSAASIRLIGANEYLVIGDLRV